MPDVPKIIETVVSGLVAGGASAATTLLAFARDIKKRLTEIETKLGVSEEPRTGLFYTVWSIEETLKRFKREVDSWDDDPPDWAKRLVSRTRSTSSMSLDHLNEVEQRVDQKIRTFNERIKSAQDELDELDARLKKVESAGIADMGLGKLVSREEYDRDSKARAEEIVKIREALASANGVLRGVMAAQGYTEIEKDGRKR